MTSLINAIFSRQRPYASMGLFRRGVLTSCHVCYSVVFIGRFFFCSGETIEAALYTGVDIFSWEAVVSRIPSIALLVSKIMMIHDV